MKFRCQKSNLLDGVSKASRGVASKSVNPSLEGILLSSEDKKIYLTGYDLELGVRTSLDASVQEKGQVVLNSKLFLEIVSKLPGESVDFSCDEKLMCTLTSGSAVFTVLGSPAEDYPEIPEVSADKIFSAGSALFKSMIEQTIFAAAVSDSNPVHMGTLFETAENELKMVAVDGCRLAIRKEEIKCSEERKFVVPAKTLSEISRFTSYDSESDIHVSAERKHILFKIEGLTVISRLLEGDFLNYKNAISGEEKATAFVNTRDFSESVSRVSLLINDRLKSPIKCVFEANRIAVSCTTAIGRAFDEMNIDYYEGDRFEIGFNNKYLIDALRACDCDRVKILIGSEISPMKILPPEGDRFLFLVLPVRLKKE